MKRVMETFPCLGQMDRMYCMLPFSDAETNTNTKTEIILPSCYSGLEHTTTGKIRTILPHKGIIMGECHFTLPQLKCLYLGHQEFVGKYILEANPDALYPLAELEGGPGGPRTTMRLAHTKQIDIGNFDPQQPNIEYVGASAAFREYGRSTPLRIPCCVVGTCGGGRRRTTSDSRRECSLNER